MHYIHILLLGDLFALCSFLDLRLFDLLRAGILGTPFMRLQELFMLMRAQELEQEGYQHGLSHLSDLVVLLACHHLVRETHDLLRQREPHM